MGHPLSYLDYSVYIKIPTAHLPTLLSTLWAGVGLFPVSSFRGRVDCVRSGATHRKTQGKYVRDDKKSKEGQKDERKKKNIGCHARRLLHPLGKMYTKSHSLIDSQRARPALWKGLPVEVSIPDFDAI